MLRGAENFLRVRFCALLRRVIGRAGKIGAPFTVRMHADDQRS